MDVPAGRLVRLRFRITLLILSALAVIPVTATRADAHAMLATSTPAPGSVVAAPPAAVVVTFTETPDPELSKIQVLDATGTVRASGGTPRGPGSTTLALALPPLPQGVYTVSWRTVSAVDGHLALGSFSFGVGVAPGTVPAPSAATMNSPRPSALAVSARWVYLWGLIALVGFAFTEVVTVVVRPAPRRLRRGQALGWALGALGAVGITVSQLRTAGVGLGHVRSTSIGHAFDVRTVPLVVAGVLLAVAARGPDRRRRAVLSLAGLAAVAAMVGDAWESHAAAVHRFAAFEIAVQAGHIAAAGVWIGGLAGLLAVLGVIPAGERAASARRYSTAALVGFVAVAATGSVRAFDEVSSWHELFSTGYGQLIMVKVGLLGLLGVLGAANRYRNVPRVERRADGLRRVGRVELAVVAVVLLATSVLQNLAPALPAAAASAAPATPPVVVAASDPGDTVRLRLTVGPGTAGFDTFTAALSDYTTGKPLTAADVSGVSIGFRLPARPDLGGSDLALVSGPHGTWTGRGANLSILGRWALTVLVERDAGAVDVPVALVTASPPEPTDITRNTRLPTVYTVHLRSGGTIQLYMEKTSCCEELHATFYDPGATTETDMASLDVSDAVGAGPAVVLDPGAIRKLDPLGHYVADAPMRAGIHHLSVTAITADGRAVGASVAIPAA